jgi:hypothetical protein
MQYIPILGGITMFEFNILPKTLEVLKQIQEIPKIHSYFHFSVPQTPEACRDTHKLFETKLKYHGLQASIVYLIKALLDWYAVKFNIPPKKQNLTDLFPEGLSIAGIILYLKNRVSKEIYDAVLFRASESQFIIVQRINMIVEWYDPKKIATVNHRSPFWMTPLITLDSFLNEYLLYMKGYNPVVYGRETKAWIGFCLQQQEKYGVNLLFTEEEYTKSAKEMASAQEIHCDYPEVKHGCTPEEKIIEEMDSSETLRNRMKKLDYELWNIYTRGNQQETLEFLKGRNNAS